MVKYIAILTVFSMSVLAGGSKSPKESDFQLKWSNCEACDHPESVYFDTQSGFLFVSNVGGEDPTKKDANGKIQKLDLEGKVISDKWIHGLDAPKGMRSHKGTLWVSDIDRVISVDIAKGKIIHKIPVPGAKFLNDVAVDSEGNVFVSDTIAWKIFKIDTRGKVSEFMGGAELESPNGLLVHKGKLLVAAWGKTKDWSTPIPGRLFSVDLKTKEKTLITKISLGNLDGLEIDKSGNYLVSDWVAGLVYRIRPNGESEVILQGFKGAADIGYIPQKNLIVVPRMGENMITAYELK